MSAQQKPVTFVKSKDDNKDEEKEKKEESKPSAVDDDGKDESKDDEKKRIGIIEFKWNKEMTEKKKCDTFHMIYLLQCALEKVRLRTIERNQHFKSLGRTDRCRNPLDAPQVITNFLEWHNKDKDNNKFDGEILTTKQKRFVTNDIIGKIGNVNMGSAIKIFAKLQKDVVIETRKWLKSPQPKLQLKTYGFNKMYKEKVLDECSVEEIVLLLKNDVFQSVIDLNAPKKKPSALEGVDKWQEKIIQFFIDNELDGKQFIEFSIKDLVTKIVDSIEVGNNKLRVGVRQVIRGLKKCDKNVMLINYYKNIDQNIN